MYLIKYLYMYLCFSFSFTKTLKVPNLYFFFKHEEESKEKAAERRPMPSLKFLSFFCIDSKSFARSWHILQRVSPIKLP